MVKVTLKFIDSTLIDVRIPAFVYELWLGEMRAALNKFATIVTAVEE